MPPATPISAPFPSAPRERARTARREALLETAESVFAERGFAGATMAEIARNWGVSRQLVSRMVKEATPRRRS